MIIPIKELFNTMPADSLTFLLAGGIAYTVGAVIYAVKKPNLTGRVGFHEIFHFFIVAGAILHLGMVFTAVNMMMNL